MSEECVALREKASGLESELGRERELRSGAEKLAGELQTSLTRESERAEDLKVRSCFTGLCLKAGPRLRECCRHGRQKWQELSSPNLELAFQPGTVYLMHQIYILSI